MSGDTETCGVHLDGAPRFILQARSWKSRYSNKALAFHRIYFYLHTIYQSILVIPNSGSQDYPCGALPASPESGISGVFDEDKSALPPSLLLQPKQLLCTYTNVYGIPQSLLALLCRTIGLVNKVVEDREQVKTRTLSPHVASLCDELESCIMDLNRDSVDDLTETPTNKQSLNLLIIHHTTQAFYNTIIIYFAQHIRLLRHHYMQPFIIKDIDSIEVIERVKNESGILATPLHWPAFIAASESF